MRYHFRPLVFVNNARKELKALPEDVQDDLGQALLDVQWGDVPTNAKPMKGFRGVTVMEIVERYRTNTYRAVYTARLEGVIYVLHCFQKKSKRGATPKPDMEIIANNLKEAQARHQIYLKQKEQSGETETGNS